MGGTFVVAMLALALAVPRAGGATASLSMNEARSQTQSTASSFTLRHDLTESHVTRCRRRSARSIGCTAIAKGETSAATIVCRLAVTVRVVHRRFYDDIASVLMGHRCTRTPKEQLTYRAALTAIQSAADRFAGTRTAIAYMFRRDEVTYSATAKWERPAAHPTEYLLTESCSVDLVASLANGKVSVVTEGSACY